MLVAVDDSQLSAAAMHRQSGRMSSRATLSPSPSVEGVGSRFPDRIPNSNDWGPSNNRLHIVSKRLLYRARGRIAHATDALAGLPSSPPSILLRPCESAVWLAFR